MAATLAELDRLAEELRRARASVLGNAAPDREGNERTVGSLLPPFPASEGVPVLYLEERIDSADRLTRRLGQEVEKSGGRSRAVDDHLEAIHQELGRAARELQFLVSEVGAGFDRPAKPATARAAWDESDEPPVRTRSADVNDTLPVRPVLATGAQFEEFTAERYDTTVAQLKSRRRSLLGWTIGLAVGISGALEVLNLLAHEPTPVPWLAFLPIVWILPVPFFVLSFRGTQRVLKGNHLETGVDG